MRIEHLAIWVKDLEKMKNFYCLYFNMECSDKYVNLNKGFSSYFLSFEKGTRIELMKRADICSPTLDKGSSFGLCHFAISVENKTEVNRLTELMRNDGYTILAEPRTTGDGYYESVISDPEGNHVEITQ